MRACTARRAAVLPDITDTAHAYMMLTSRLEQRRIDAPGVAAGVMADTCHKPDLLFLVATSLDADAVRANFAGIRATRYANARL